MGWWLRSRGGYCRSQSKQMKTRRLVIYLGARYESPSYEWVLRLAVYYCHHVVLLVSSTSNQRYHLRKIHKITDPDHNANDQQMTLDSHMLRPFRVDIARKLLVEYYV